MGDNDLSFLSKCLRCKVIVELPIEIGQIVTCHNCKVELRVVALPPNAVIEQPLKFNQK